MCEESLNGLFLSNDTGYQILYYTQLVLVLQHRKNMHAGFFLQNYILTKLNCMADHEVAVGKGLTLASRFIVLPPVSGSAAGRNPVAQVFGGTPCTAGSTGCNGK